MEGRKAKYIVVKLERQEHIIPFSSGLIHKKMADRFRRPVISAGFIRFTDGGPICYGESTSLSIDSRPEEDSLLAQFAFGEEMF